MVLVQGKRVSTARKAKNRSRAAVVKETIRVSVPKSRQNKRRKKNRNSGNSPTPSTFIRRKEYIGTISAQGGVEVPLLYPVQMLATQTFPWLSGVAANWESYRIRKLDFRYVSSTANMVTGSLLGTVSVGFNYDLTDSMPDSKIAVNNLPVHTQKKLSEDWKLSIPLDKLPISEWYVDNTIGPGLEAKFTGPGALVVVVYTPAALTGPVGDMYVDYDVELIRPKLSGASPIGDSADWMHIYTTTQTATASAGNYLGAVTSPRAYDGSQSFDIRIHGS
jgi:hypothetical protein